MVRCGSRSAHSTPRPISTLPLKACGGLLRGRSSATQSAQPPRYTCSRMTALLLIATYCALVTFATGCLRRARQYAKLPVHLRWELYPVPHETSPRAAHGGSYFEESEWWTKPRRVNRTGELAVMAREILLLETVRKAKPSLWWRSQIFHSGVFLVIMAIGCD